jgi:hypothetical protein
VWSGHQHSFIRVPQDHALARYNLNTGQVIRAFSNIVFRRAAARRCIVRQPAHQGMSAIRSPRA